MIDLTFLAAAASAVTRAAAPEAEPRLLGLDAEGWVYLGITVFLALAFFKFKAHRLITDALDSHIAEARRTLDEAAAIRGEAEALLNEAKAKLADAKDDARAMLAHARDEAEALIAKAEADTGEVIALREKMAADKIAAAERAAVTAIRARAANGAINVAQAVIAKMHDAGADKVLVDGAIGAL